MWYTLHSLECIELLGGNRMRRPGMEASEAIMALARFCLAEVEFAERKEENRQAAQGVLDPERL